MISYEKLLFFICLSLVACEEQLVDESVAFTPKTFIFTDVDVQPSTIFRIEDAENVILDYAAFAQVDEDVQEINFPRFFTPTELTFRIDLFSADSAAFTFKDRFLDLNESSVFWEQIDEGQIQVYFGNDDVGKFQFNEDFTELRYCISSNFTITQSSSSDELVAGQNFNARFNCPEDRDPTTALNQLRAEPANSFVVGDTVAINISELILTEEQ